MVVPAALCVLCCALPCCDCPSSACLLSTAVDWEARARELEAQVAELRAERAEDDKLDRCVEKLKGARG